jgi:cell division protein FtsQ
MPPKLRPPVPPGQRLRRWLSATLWLSLLAGGGAWLGQWLLAPGNLPLQRVRVDGEVRHTRRETLEQTLKESLDGNFFGLDLAAVRTRVEALPWVSRASVRRVWPATLVVRIHEREALARWGSKALLSPAGEVFQPEAVTIPAGLVQLYGPPDAGPEVAERFQWLRGLLAPRGLQLARAELSDRRAWTLHLTDGTELVLGNRELEPRLRRYLQFRTELARHGAPRRVDLRYGNGFAVLWQTPATTTGAEG